MTQLARLRIFSACLATAILFWTIALCKGPDVYRLPQPVHRTFASIDVTVSPGIELMSIVQTISTYPKVFGFLMTKDSSRYKEDVLKSFSALKEHPAVKLFEKLAFRPRMLNFSAPSAILLYADENLNLRNDLRFDQFILSRAGGKDTLALLFRLLQDFARESAFNSFYEKHTNLYMRMVSNTIETMDSTDTIHELEAFYGAKLKSYTMNLAPLYSFVGYGNSIVHDNGAREAYITLGPQVVKENVPSFGNRLYLRWMTRHEFSHPYVNPLTEKYWDLIKADSAKYDSIPGNAKRGVCGDWQECIDEFTIRAITTSLAYRDGEQEGAFFEAKEKSKGVSNLDALRSELRVYETNRALYPTFDSFFPKILRVFKNQTITP